MSDGAVVDGNFGPVLEVFGMPDTNLGGNGQGAEALCAGEIGTVAGDVQDVLHFEIFEAKNDSRFLVEFWINTF